MAEIVQERGGNASGIDRPRGLMVIKPSGVAYEKMKPEEMVVVALDSGEEVRATVSVGVAVFPESGTTMDTLIRVADTGLYAAKAGGRNRVHYEPVSGQQA